MTTFMRLWLKRLVRIGRPFLKSAGMLQMSGVYGRTATAWRPGAERVLVLAPHMDDETIGCGGTLALHARCGARITVVFMTDGSQGTVDVTTLSGEARVRREREINALRKAESALALHELGIHAAVYLDGPDGRLSARSDLAARLRAVIEECRPDLIYLPHFLEEHPDHRATTDVLLAACEGTSWEFLCMGYEIWTPLFPNCLVRVSETIELKKRALSHYASQIAQANYTQACLGLNAYRAIGLLDSHDAYAEAFCAVPFAKYREQYFTFGTSAPQQEVD